jgi:cell division protein FtsI/penicillin-binding protein 2/cell division protein FtsW (lipid II flippase)
MAVTKSWDSRVAPQIAFGGTVRNTERRREFWWLLGVTLLVGYGLAVVFAAKTQDFPDLQAKLTSGDLLNLDATPTKETLDKALVRIDDSAERAYVAERLQTFLAAHGPLPNVGALSRLRLTAVDAASDPRALSVWRAATADRKVTPASVSLLAISKFKPLVVVRSPKEFVQIYLTWVGLYLAAFWIVHLLWRLRRFQGDGTLLPAIHLLSGMGLMLMVSLRDPLRDTLEFKKFAWGCVAGCALLLLPLFKMFDYRRFSKMVYTPLLVALVLFFALLRLGSGPTGSDAKVNLGPFQPVEAIKVLLVFFLAAYFAKNWERLRDLHQTTLVPGFLRALEFPRLNHVLPVMFGVSCALAMFFVLKDMGPALVLGFVFLLLFSVARGKAGLALLGLTILIVGVAVGNHLGTPHTVVERVAMWLSPWNNDVRGGDQLAHSLWAFATGGPLGSGPGWGDPSVIPAGHTDLVLASIAEEWGVPGVAAIALLFVFLLRRGFRISLAAPDEFGVFLGLGLSCLIGLEMLLISGGALGAIPLSGVVSPFLSSGNTAMLANFFIFAVLAGISHQSAPTEAHSASLEPIFRFPARVAGVALGMAAVALLARAVYVETIQDQQLVARDALVFTADGVKRPEHNPRLMLLAAEIPRGDIFDRNGVLLATSRWGDLEMHRDELQKLGVDIDEACRRSDIRYYPFGPATEHLLGDLRTGEKFHATNASLIEHDSNSRLQGYNQLSDLAPVVRYRHQRANPQLQALLKRDRDVHATLDIRLQMKAVQILNHNLEASHKKGALVVINAGSGEVLALASYPEPPVNGPGTPDELLDRARYGEYPPGSTFKLVTAIAALRIDPRATEKRYNCHALGDGRTGTIIPGWRRPIRDDIEDHAHGTIDMEQAITVSCNAYFAQLGVDAVGSQALRETAALFGIPIGTPEQVKKMLPFTSYGQGEALMTPFKMARVAATIADSGEMPEGTWVTDPSNKRLDAPHPILAAPSAEFLQRAMRNVVTNGTARTAMAGLDVSVAGKTGTAQLDEGEPHSWFAGFAPFDTTDPKTRISFAVVVEHGGYGAKFAAPIARQVVEAARDIKMIPTQGGN